MPNQTNADLELAYQNALADLTNNKVDEAIAAFQAILEKDPNHIGVLYALAGIYEHGQGTPKDLQKAKEYYLRIIEQDKTKPDVYYRLAMIDEKAEDRKAHLEAAADLGHAKAKLSIAKSLLRKSQFVEAQKILESLPDAGEALYLLALLYRDEKIGELKEGKPDYQKVVDLLNRAQNTSAEAKHTLALLYFYHLVPGVDKERSFKLGKDLMVSAAKVHGEAAYDLACLYRVDVIPNLEKARDLKYKPAERRLFFWRHHDLFEIDNPQKVQKEVEALQKYYETHKDESAFLILQYAMLYEDGFLKDEAKRAEELFDKIRGDLSPEQVKYFNEMQKERKELTKHIHDLLKKDEAISKKKGRDLSSRIFIVNFNHFFDILTISFLTGSRTDYEKSIDQHNNTRAINALEAIKKEASQHRAKWKPILANVLIGLTGLGAIALVMKIVAQKIQHKSLSFNQTLFFATTRSERLVSRIESKEKALLNQRNPSINKPKK